MMNWNANKTRREQKANSMPKISDSDRELVLQAIRSNSVNTDSVNDGVQIACPKCDYDRKKTGTTPFKITVKEPNFVIFNCAHCGNLSGGLKVDLSKRSANNTRSEPLPIEYKRPSHPDNRGWSDTLRAEYEARGISDNTRQAFGVHLTVYPMAWVKGGDKYRECVAFKYMDGDELLCVKYRATNEKDFRQSWKPEPSLYNVNRLRDYLAKDDNKGNAFIVEGELDVLSLYECKVQHAVSLPGGASKANNKSRAELFNKYPEFGACKTIYLAGDNDIPGANLSGEIAKVVGADKCRLVDWSHKCEADCWKPTTQKDNAGNLLTDANGEVLQVACKDANDVLARHGVKAVHDCIQAARPFLDVKVERAQKSGMDNLLDGLDPKELKNADKIAIAFDGFLQRNPDIHMVFDEQATEDSQYIEWVKEGYWVLHQEKILKDRLLLICMEIAGNSVPAKLRKDVWDMVKTHLRLKRKTYAPTELNRGDSSVPFAEGYKSLSLNDGRGIIDTPREDLMIYRLATRTDEMPKTQEEFDKGEFSQMLRDWFPTREEQEVFFKKKPEHGDKDKIRWWQICHGQTLMGNPAGLVVHVYGKGGEGKSMNFDCIKTAVGLPYYFVTPESVYLKADGQQRHRSDREGLDLCRWSVVPEVDEQTSVWVSGNIKELAGRNTVNVGAMYKKNENKLIAVAPFIIANHKVPSRDLGIGLRRRVKLFTFNNMQRRPDGQEEDTDRHHAVVGNLQTDLLERVKGQVMFWLMEGVKIWNAECAKSGRMPRNIGIDTETSSYFDEQDVFISCLKEIAEPRPGGYILKQDLIDAMREHFPEQFKKLKWFKIQKVVVSKMELTHSWNKIQSEGGKYGLKGWVLTGDREPPPAQAGTRDGGYDTTRKSGKPKTAEQIKAEEQIAHAEEQLEKGEGPF